MMRNKTGSVLLEALLAVALFAVVASTGVSMLYRSSSTAKEGADYVVAAGLVHEGIEAVRSIRDRQFSEITNGTHGLDTASGYYEFSGTSDSLFGGEFTRTITVDDVLRDGSDNIAGSGSVDEDTKKITVNVIWDTLVGKTQNLYAVYYVFDFSFLQFWVQTLLADFTAGSHSSTVNQSAGNGEVALRNMQATWAGLTRVYTGDTDGTGNVIDSAFDESQDIALSLSLNTAGDELTKFDVANLTGAGPERLDSYDVGGANPYSIAISNGYAFIATDGTAEEVAVVRISDLTRVNTIDITGTAAAYSVAITGTKLIVGRALSADNEVYVYNIASPEGTISLLGSTNLPNACPVMETDGTYAYCGSLSDTAEITVVRLSDYTAVNTVNLTGTGDVYDLLVNGTSLYVGRDDVTTDVDFMELSLATPASSLATLHSVNTSSAVWKVDLNENATYAFLGTSDDAAELTVVQLSSFTETQTADASGSADGRTVMQFGSYVITGSDFDSAEINVFETTDLAWTVPQRIGSANLTGTADAAVTRVDSHYAYVGLTVNASGAEFFIYDIATPSSPTLLGSFETGSSIFDIAVSGNYAYLATTDDARELDIINITNKASPSRAGAYNMAGTANSTSVELTGIYAALGRQASTANEFWIINVTNPASPTLTGSMNYASNINDIAIHGGLVYGATANDTAELIVINATTPSAPAVIATDNNTTTEDGFSVAWTGALLVLGRAVGAGTEFVTYNIATPTAPVRIGGGEVANRVNDIVFDGSGYAYIGTGPTGTTMERWNVTTPASPVVYSSFTLDGNGNRLAFDGTNVYIATGGDSRELDVIGPATAPADYPLASTFTSQAFDSGSASTNWSEIAWSSSGTGTIVFRVRSASTEAGLDTAQWVGSDGTRSTTYSSSGTSITTSAGATGTRWFQWKAYMTGSGSATPILQDVTISYEL